MEFSVSTTVFKSYQVTIAYTIPYSPVNIINTKVYLWYLFTLQLFVVLKNVEKGIGSNAKTLSSCFQRKNVI